MGLSTLENLTISNTFTFELGGLTIHLKKFGKIIMCIIQHQGGISDAALPSGTVPEAFRTEHATYLSAPCITGSPYIAILNDGRVEFRINGATFQNSISTTTYYLTQSYISKFY